MRILLWMGELNEWFIVSVHTSHSPSTFSICYLLCSVCCSTSLSSVCLCSFLDSVSTATRAKHALCTSAGILKLHRGDMARKIHNASRSLLLPQNWTISAKTVVLVAAVNAWHVTARKLFWKMALCQRRLNRERDVWVRQCMLPRVPRKNSTETISALLYVGGKDRALRRFLPRKTTSQ